MKPLPQSKKCPKCGKRKPRDAFYLDWKREGALHTYCKDCCKSKAKESYARSDKAERTRIHREWVRANRDHIRAYKVAQSLGITVQEVEAVLARGKCDLCGSTEGLCVDHCHRAGHIRGLLCSACNKGLGFFRDDPRLLRKAARYLG